MSEQAQNNNTQTLVIGLVVIAALLAAIVGVLIYQQNKASTAVPAPTAVSSGSTAPAASGAPAGMGSGSSAAPAAEFDAKTAPKVAAGQSPEEYVKAYYALCEKGDYAKAYKMLPTSMQSYYGSSDQFKSTLQGYGVTGYKVEKSTASGDEVKVVGVQNAQGMDFAYTWVFVKQGNDYLVKSREMGGQ